jgi:hypothetical protein
LPWGKSQLVWRAFAGDGEAGVGGEGTVNDEGGRRAWGKSKVQS